MHPDSRVASNDANLGCAYKVRPLSSSPRGGKVKRYFGEQRVWKWLRRTEWVDRSIHKR